MGRDGTGVRAASASSIEIAFTYRGIRCRERVQLKPTPANLKRAARHRAAILDAIERGTFDYAHTFPDSPRIKLFARVQGDLQTVSEHLGRWLEETRHRVKASTWAGFANIVRHHVGPVADVPLSRLTRRHVKDMARGWGVGPKTVRNRLSVLRMALDEAVEDEIIDAHPLQAWAYRLPDKRVRETDDVDPFTPDEQAAVLQVLQGQDRNLVQLALWTGLRTSELIALRWTDVDWTAKTTRVVRAKTNAADEPETPKTTAARREIKLLSPAEEALKAQRSATELAGREIFHNPRTGAPWASTGAIRAMWERALRRARIRYRRPYQTRHTYASMMLSAGESPLWVARQMGHSDWTMIARVYGKWIPDADPEAGQKAVRAFWNDNITPARTRNPLKS